MEGYLRLVLLLVAAVIIFLILFEAWYRRRQIKVSSHPTVSTNTSAQLSNPDEMLSQFAAYSEEIDPVLNEMDNVDELDSPILKGNEEYIPQDVDLSSSTSSTLEASSNQNNRNA